MHMITRSRVVVIAMLPVMIAVNGCATRTVVPAIDQGYITTPDGVRLFYRRVGSGTSAVIVPGDLFLFTDFQQLSRRRTIVFYDMRNRGRSDAVRDSTAITIQKDVEDLETIRRHFAFERVQLIGYSYLGMMVIMYTMAHPDRVDRVVQLGPVPRQWDTQYPPHLTHRGPVPGVDSAQVERVRQLAQNGFRESNPREFCELLWSVSRFGLVGNPEHVDRLGGSRCDLPNEWPINFARHLRHHFASVRATRVTRDEVAHIAVPVLTIHGTQDRNAPYGGGRQWALELPNARLLTINAGAHQVWVDAPTIVLRAIDTFLRGEWPVGSQRVSVLDPGPDARD